MALLQWLKHIEDRFLSMVDAEVVRPFQGIVYLGVLAAAAYMTLYGAPSVVDENLGHAMFLIWMAMCYAGPLLAAAGDSLVNSGKHLVLHTERGGGGKQIYLGWYLQAVGDMLVTAVLCTYVIATFETSWLRRGIFAAFVLASLAGCAAVLTLRDVRKIRAIEKV